MQIAAMMHQSSAAKPVKLGNFQLVIVEILLVLTWSACSEYGHKRRLQALDE